MVEVVRLGNIRGAIKVGVKKKEETTQEVVEEDAKDHLEIADALQAQDLFKAYSEVLAQKKRTSLASFFSDPLLEVHSDKIVFKVGSKLIADEINKEVKNLMRFFREKGYALVEVKCEVNAKEVSEYKMFTPEQQFDVMAKDFPILQELKARFNLEIDG